MGWISQNDLYYDDILCSPFAKTLTAASVQYQKGKYQFKLRKSDVTKDF